MSGWGDDWCFTGVTFCMTPLKAWQRWKSSASCLRWPAPICHSLQLVSAWPSQTDSLLCREKNGRAKEIKMLRSLFKSISLWQSPNLVIVKLSFLFVSSVRSLTLEKEPLHSHWLQKPAVKKETEEKTLKETVNKEETFNPHRHSHLKFTPPSICEESQSHHTGLIGFLIDSCPSSLLLMSTGELFRHILEDTTSGPQWLWNLGDLERPAGDRPLFFSHPRMILLHPQNIAMKQLKSVKTWAMCLEGFNSTK